MEIVAKNPVKSLEIFNKFQKQKILDFFKKLIVFHTEFLRCFQNIKKVKKKIEIQKITETVYQECIFIVFFSLYNKTILKIKKNITKTLNFDTNLCHKKITIITPNNNKNNTINSINSINGIVFMIKYFYY